ncbi:MAG TPA: hypothetical protein VL970_09495 [Candidatus Acidoferrales bacterium]|nr:hypothetical protein [Candidatus Acidoferrales bacterium]
MCARANDANQPATNPPENGALTVAPSDTNPSSNFDEDQIGLPKYRDQELDIDLFGSGVLGEETIEHISGSRFRHRSLWGGGGGATIFFLKYLGVGGDFDADAHAGRFVDNAAGNVYLRLPIYNTGLAPYIFGGGGYQFEDLRQAFGDGGGGLEFRLCRHVGIFADGRYVGTAQTKSYVEARAGVRIAF